MLFDSLVGLTVVLFGVSLWLFFPLVQFLAALSFLLYLLCLGDSLFWHKIGNLSAYYASLFIVMIGFCGYTEAMSHFEIVSTSTILFFFLTLAKLPGELNNE